MVQHTKTPWYAEGMAIDSRQFEIANTFGGAQDMDGNTIGDETAHANAAFIVRAVNSHEALVEAITELLNTEKETDEYPVSSHEELIRLNQRWKKALEAAQAALKLAKGE